MSLAAMAKEPMACGCWRALMCRSRTVKDSEEVYRQWHRCGGERYNRPCTTHIVRRLAREADEESRREEGEPGKLDLEGPQHVWARCVALSRHPVLQRTTQDRASDGSGVDRRREQCRETPSEPQVPPLVVLDVGTAQPEEQRDGCQDRAYPQRRPVDGVD